MLDKIKRLQSFVVEVGLGRSVLALPAPKTLLIEDETSSDDAHSAVFAELVREPEIVDVARDLYASGYYNIAVAEAFKAVDHVVRECSGLSAASGTNLMDAAFSPGKPKLSWSERLTESERSEQRGYHQIFSGAMLGIRNPTTHEFDWVADSDIAIELLVFAQHLVRKAKLAQKT